MQNVREVSRNVFELRLTIGFGKHLIMSASEFTPTASSELNSSVYVEIDPETKLSRRIVRPTLFVTIHMPDTKEISKQLNDWAEDIITHHLDGWADFCCSHLGWEREILKVVCRFFTDLVRYKELSETDSVLWPSDFLLLKRTLKVSILMFLLRHPLLVSEDDKERLGETLGATLPNDPVSPRLANKFVKMALVPMVRSLVHLLFDGIDTMLRTIKGSDESSIGFCVLILLLMIIGEIEIALDDIVACANVGGDVSKSRTEVSAEIQEIDRELSQVLIGLFRAKYKWQRGHTFSDIGKLHKYPNDPTKNLALGLSEVVISHGMYKTDSEQSRTD